MRKPWPVQVEIPVAWGDMDAFAHVNNTVYFKWFEAARIALFERCDVMAGMDATGMDVGPTAEDRMRVGPILASTGCNYRLPLEFPDTVIAEAAIKRIGNSSFVMAYRVISERLGAVAADGEGVIVMLDYGSGAKVPIDDGLRARLGACLLPE